MAATLLASERLRSSPRRTRSPQHPFYLRYRPWQIQPFVIAPVLPGETLTGATLQSRVVSDPIKNPLMGWWTEYYFFYVKHRDMTDRDKLTAMMLNVQEDVSTLKVAAKAAHYHQASSFDWVEMCKRRVVEEYFRDGDDAYPGVEIDSMPVAAINQNSWLDSAYLDDDIPDATVETTSTDLSLEGFEQAYITWQFMRANQLIDMDYEDYLATYGIRKNRTELHKPELIRYVRDWTYPTNTIDPSNGAARSAVSWSFTERISKDRFFTEPGFVFGVTVTRPKVYRTQGGHLVDWLDSAIDWLPAIMADHPETSLKQFAETEGPIAATVTDANGYWVDIRDLFLYGDQFINFAPTTDTVNLITAPAATVDNWEYPSATDAAELFVDETTNRLIRADGMVQLHIKSFSAGTDMT